MTGEEALELLAALREIVPEDYEADDEYTADAHKLGKVHALLYGESRP